MKRFKPWLLAAAVVGTMGPQALAADSLKIGMISTLSGPAAVLGQHMRDGFMLAVEEKGGKLGGLPTEVLVEDDGLKPDAAVTKAQAMVSRDKVDFVVGPIFSNVLQAIMRPITKSETFLISPNAGTSTFAGKGCSPYFFVTSYQNDQVHEVLGKVATNKGYKKVFLMAPNYQAGKDSLAGFKHSFEGEVVDEVYTPLGHKDFSAELAKLSVSGADAIFTFMPGGMGVNLVKQFRQAGLADTMPFLSAFTVDESTLPGQKDAAIGFQGGANWAPDLDNPQNKAFVAAFEKKYGYVPATFAFQAYDAAMLIDSAITAVGGDLANKDAVRKALEKADFTSLRGKFAFNTNHYPIQDFYLVEASKRADGKYQTQIVEKVFTDYADNYVDACKMN